MVNEAVTDFMLWFDAKADEQKPGRQARSLKKGQVWVPKYDTVADILSEYGAEGTQIDPVAARIVVDREAMARIEQAIADETETLF